MAITNKIENKVFFGRRKNKQISDSRTFQRKGGITINSYQKGELEIFQRSYSTFIIFIKIYNKISISEKKRKFIFKKRQKKYKEILKTK